MNENNNNNNQSLSSFYGNEEIDNNQPAETNNETNNNSVSEMNGNQPTSEDSKEPTQPEQESPVQEQVEPQPEQPNQTNNVTGTDIKAVKAFVGEKYQNFVNGGFNIGAFFFGPIYYFYRKMYLYGIIFWIIAAVLSPIALIVRIVCGFMTNGIYLKFASEKVKELSSQYSGDELLNHCKQQGGTNIGIVIIFAIIDMLSILSIVILIGVPYFQRNINSERSDQMVDTAKEYANAVKTAWASDELTCGGVQPTNLEEGYYYVWFKTGGDIPGVTDPSAETNKQRLIQSGGLSPWGNANLGGYVKIELSSSSYYDSSNKYKVYIVDEQKHGIVSDVPSDNLTRYDVKPYEALLPTPAPDPYNQTEVVTCTVTPY